MARFASAVVEADRLQARRMLELANVISHAVAVGVVAAGGSWDKKASRKASQSYDQMMRGLMARATGYAGKTHDAYGRPIAKSLGEVRSWLVQKKVIREHRRRR